MRLRCIHCVSHNGEIHEPGATVEVDDVAGMRLLDLGAAERVGEASANPSLDLDERDANEATTDGSSREEAATVVDATDGSRKRRR